VEAPVTTATPATGEDPTPDRLSARDGMAALAVGLAALAAYTLRMLQDVGFWDTAVFQGAAPVLGLTHPTGYPTYLLLGWLWTHLLPMLEPAYAMNLLATVTGAGAVALTFLLGRRIGGGMAAAAAGALTAGLMLAFWRTASRADPHPLHVLLALSIILLLLAWDRRGDARPLVLAAVLFGLAMGNHLLTSMLAPGIAVYVLTRQPSVIRQPKVVLAAAAGLALGLLVYAYIPIRAAANPPIHHDFAPTTPELFLRYVLGQDFSGSMGFLTAAGLGTAVRELGTFAAQLGDSLSVPVALGVGFLSLAGFYTLLRDRRWRTAWLLAATGGLTLYARLTYANADLERYALYPVALMGALAALGATTLWEGLVAGPWRVRAVAPAPDDADPGAERRRWLVVAVPLVLLAVPAYLFVTNVDRINIASARCYLDDAAAKLEPDAVVISWWSYATPLWYLQAVEGGRSDITVVLTGSNVAEEVARRQVDGRPLYAIQFEGELQRLRDAGATLEEVALCGVSAWRVTGVVASPAPAP
jgi:Protein O-mannosyl-transferase TMEM260-like